MGYPAGIGPEVISESLASPEIRRLANFLVIGDEAVFKKALKVTRKRFNYHKIQDKQEPDFSRSGILFLDLLEIQKSKFSFGKVVPEYGRASIRYIDKALAVIKHKKADALVTGPIHKRAAEMSGFKYSGHTEYLARKTGTKRYAMMLSAGSPAPAAGRLNVVLATTHIPIKKVASNLKQGKIRDKLFLADYHLRHYCGIRHPKIAVCGLNPHAGEDGIIGTEEKSVILPAIRTARAQGVNAAGPFAADGLFYNLLKGSHDAVLCMYHDQGLVALKMFGRNRSVNITLGLPFIRTSPGHGTALDIAGKGRADPGSMKHAIREAVGFSTS